MAVEKTKIQERLKVLFPGVNLSKARIEQISSRLSQKPKDDAEDAEIDEVINNANDFMPFADLAKEDDRVRTLEALTKKKDPETPPTTPPADPATPPKPDDAPAWAKALLDKVAALESQQKGQTLAQKQNAFLAAAKTKGIPDNIAKYVPITDETNTDEVLTNLETDWKAVQQEQFNSSGTHQPFNPQGTAGKGKPTEKEVDEILDKI